MLLLEQEKTREGVERNGKKKNQEAKKASLLQSRERTGEDVLQFKASRNVCKWKAAQPMCIQ